MKQGETSSVKNLMWTDAVNLPPQEWVLDQIWTSDKWEEFIENTHELCSLNCVFM